MVEEERLKEIELQIRIRKLTPNSLRAALFSIENIDDLEKAVNAGEHFQELVSKLKKKEEK